RKPGEAQDRSDDQNDHKSRKRVGDERREKDTANHQITKGMGHEPSSMGALAACVDAASITAPARRRAAPASIARYSSPEAASRKLRAMARMRCASRSTRAVRASAARIAKGHPQAWPAWRPKGRSLRPDPSTKMLPPSGCHAATQPQRP